MVHLLGRSILPDRQVGGSILDSEFGNIRLIRNNGNTMRLSVRTNGEIVVSVPRRLSTSHILRFIDNSRPSIRRMIVDTSTGQVFGDGSKVGHRHYLQVKSGVRQRICISDSRVVVYVPQSYSEFQTRQLISRAVAKTLRQEATHYLPKRLKLLAVRHGYGYQRVRLTHAKTRWGSCSSTGTISLNIALMMLPDRLIDYVLLHELTHTKHMNHGAEFWRALELAMPGAKQLSRELRAYSPYV